MKTDTHREQAKGQLRGGWRMQLQAKNRQGLPATPEAGKRQGHVHSPQSLRGSIVLPAPSFWTSSLRAGREHIGVVLNHTAWGV